MLSTSKTAVITSEDFLANYFDDPIEIERNVLHGELRKVNTKVTGEYGFYEPYPPSRLPTGSKIKEQAERLQSLLERIVSMGALDLGLSRHMLRLAKRLRTRAIAAAVLENFDFFAPVVRDVMLYLERVQNQQMFEQNLPRLLEVTATRSARIPFVRRWLEWYIATSGFGGRVPELRSFVEMGSIRSRALLALNTKEVAWVRDYKDRLSEMGPWDKWAVIFASKALSKSERRPWLDTFETSDDLVARSVARFVRGT